MSSSSSGEPAPLADSDIAHAIALIQAAYAPAASSSSQLQSQSQSLSQIQDLQSALLAMQRTPAAWGLIVPLLSHADANVQFFGAHTAHAKIARGELAMLPPNQQQQLKDVLIQMAGTPGRSRVVRRKLYGAVVALAVRVVPGRAGGGEGEGENETWVWENWLGEVVSALAGAGAPSAWIHDFLAGAAEDVGAANLLPQAKIQLTESLRAAAPVVLQSIAAVVHEAVASNSTAASNASTGGNASNASLPPALACLTAWLPSGVLPAPDIARLVPALIALLSPPDEDSANEETITAVSTALCELLARPPAAWGAGMMLEPMMRWVGRRWPAFCNAFGGGLNGAVPDAAHAPPFYPSSFPPSHPSSFPSTSSSSIETEVPMPLGKRDKTLLRSHTRLLVALAEAGVEWVAASVVDPSHVQGASTSYTGGYPSEGSTTPAAGQGESRAQLAQTFLRVMLALTAGDAGGARLSSAQTQQGGEEDEEDDDDDAPDAGAPLGFWYLLQEALWEVPVSGGYLWAAAASASSASGSAASGQSGTAFPASGSGASTPFGGHATPSTGFGFPTSASGSGFGGGSFPTTPSSHSRGYSDMSDSQMHADAEFALLTDAQLGRGRGGAGGTPWTPGGASSSSFADVSSPTGQGQGYTSPTLGYGGGSGSAGGGRGHPPHFDSRASFGFPGSSSYSLGVNGNGNGGNEEEENDVDESPATRARAAHARAAFGALVRILRGKVVYPRAGWSRDRLERFAVYRRDAGDTLVNAYYILREDLLAFYVGDVAGRLERGAGEWEEIEASLHCLRAVHEAIDPDADAESGSHDEHGANGIPREPPLARLFGATVWGRMPGGPLAQTSWENTQGKARLRRTALAVVDTYASYFTTRPPDALLPPLQYVIGALADGDSGICLQAALALRSLCDANRRALASRIGAFAEVHAGLGGVPDSEKGKVLQSIASVIQALPPAEAVAPVEAMVGPILQRLGEALGAAGDHPEPARLAAILQLEILAGVAKGLTRTQDPLAFDEEDSGGAEADAVRAAREDPRTGAMRGALFDAIARVAELWSADSEVGQALSELFRAITALPADVTLLSLPAQPLLGVVCRAAGRRLNAVWLALATILIAQLNPPPPFLTIKAEPNEEAEAAVRAAVGEIVAAALGALGAPGGMVENPDIVQEFFACMDRVAQDFTGAFCALPDGAFDALMQCAISALALQERYSLVAACTFLGTLIHRTALYAPLSPELLQQLQAHMIRVHGRALMRAVLCGFAGAAPRSVTSNLLELMAALVARWDERAVSEAEGRAEMADARQGQGGARAWVADVVFAEDFFPSRAGQEAKERFVKTVVSSRSVKKTKEAANQFTIVAWGLEGSTFGYSSVSSV